MPVFLYTALNRDGTITKGEGSFSSLEELYYSLQREGLTLLDYKIKKYPSLSILKSKVKRKELAEFLHQLSILLKSGIPLITALDDLEREIKNRTLKGNLRKIISSIERGEAFSEAMQKTKLFPPIVISLSKIGEESGNLDKTLEEASKHLYRVEEIISQTKRALIYPSFVLLAMSGAFLFWLFYVLPQILKVFKDMGIKLPLPTILLMKTIDFLLVYKFFLLLILFSLPIIFIILYKTPHTEILIDKFLLKLPLYGRVRRLNFLAFFFEHFSLLLSAGIDLLRNLQLMKESFHRKYYKNIVQRIENAILNGETIASALKNEKIFRPLDIRMVSVGENTGRLEEQTKLLANIYFEEVQNLLNTLTKILEPVVIVIAGLIFLIIIVALIGPIYELISQLGKAS